MFIIINDYWIFFLVDGIRPQPYENGCDKYFVRQGYGQCGTASFYMIFKYYGDNRHNPGFFYAGVSGEDGNINYRQLNLVQAIPGREFPSLTKETEVAKWLNGGRIQTEWDKLTQQVKKLSLKMPAVRMSGITILLMKPDILKTAISGSWKGRKGLYMIYTENFYGIIIRLLSI